jgi:copper chaperone CopZ
MTDRDLRTVDDDGPLLLDVGPMHYASCVARVETALSGMPGVVRARANLATQQVSILPDAMEVAERTVICYHLGRGDVKRSLSRPARGPSGGNPKG